MTRAALPSLLLALPPILSGIAPAASQANGFTAFFGAEDQAGDVRVVVPGQPPAGPPALAGVQLLPVELSGRTLLHGLRPDRARWRDDVPGASRLVLPGLAGSLYRFSRAEPDGSATHGFFVVDASGAPRVLLEVPGTGAAGSDDPFVGKVAVGPAGQALLVATTPAAGGDLYEVDVATGAATDRTASKSPVAFTADGLALAPSWGTAATSQGVLRFERGVAGDAQWLPLPAGPVKGAWLPVARTAKTLPWHAGQVVLSNDGDFAMTAAGTSAQAAHVYVYSSAGPAVRVTAQAAPVSPAGFLPELEDGPFWAVSDDGARCAWRTEGAASREVWMARVDPVVAEAPVHVTQDACFDPFLDEVGQFLFVDDERLVALIGDKTGGNFILRWADVYEVRLGAPGAVPLMQNLTGTSGDLVAPYTAYGWLEPEGVYWVPDQAGLLILDLCWSNGLQGAHLDTGGLTQLLPAATELHAVERVGGSIVVGTEFDSQPATGSDAVQIHELDASLAVPSALMFDLGEDEDSFPRAGGPAGLSFVVFVDESVGDLWRMDPADGSTEMLTAAPRAYGPALDVSAAGTTYAVVDYEESFASFVVWPAGGAGATTVPAGSEAFLLPRR